MRYSSDLMNHQPPFIGRGFLPPKDIHRALVASAHFALHLSPLAMDLSPGDLTAADGLLPMLLGSLDGFLGTVNAVEAAQHTLREPATMRYNEYSYEYSYELRLSLESSTPLR